MPTTTTITTAIGATDTIINNGGGALNDTNTVAQLAAAAAGLGTLATPGGAYAAITTGMAAHDTGIQVINADINAGASKSDIAADSLTILGDVALIVGAYATNIPGAKPIATVAEVVGNGAALSGVGIKNWDAVVANTPIAINELVTEVNEEAQSAKTALITNLNGVSNTIANAWSSTEAALSNVFNAISTSMNDISNTNFMLDAGSTSSSVSSAETSLVSLFNAIGGSAQNVTDTVTNNSFVISNNNISNINGSASFGTNGGSTSLTTTGNSLNQTETDSIGSGSISDAIQNYNSSGAVQFSQTTTTNTSGQVSASISGTGDVTALNNAAITVASGASATVDGNNDAITGNGGTYSYNLNGVGDTLSVSDAFANAFAGEVTGGVDQIKFFGAAGAPATTIDIGTGSQVSITGADGKMIATNDYNGSSNVTDTINWTTPGSVVSGSASREYVMSGQQAGITGTSYDYSGANAIGNIVDEMRYGANGGAQLDLFNNGVVQNSFDFAPDSSGNLYISSTISHPSTSYSEEYVFNPTPGALPTGWSKILDFNDSSGQLNESDLILNNGYQYSTSYNTATGMPTFTNEYNSSDVLIQQVSDNQTIEDGSADDFVNSGILTNISVGLASQDSITQSSDAAATQAAEEGLLNAYAVANIPTNSHKSLKEGGTWSSNVITWSLATGPGTTGAPFSSYMSSSYLALVQQAFAAWASASGLTFQQVSDSTSADIRIGWGTFNTATSGVVGLTNYQTQNGSFLPNTIVRLEDPSQTALTANANGASTYTGTNATLYQVLEHEIGHALGLADNSDPNSVEYYQTTTSNPVVDATDSSGIQSLYSNLVTTQTFGTAGGQTLTGSSGYQVYKFAAGDKADTIVNGNSANTGPSGELDFGAGISSSNLSFSRSGNDLVINVIGSTDQVTVKNWFANGYSQLEAIQAGDGNRFITGANNTLISENYGPGTSQVMTFNPSSGIVTEVDNYSGLNGTGTKSVAWQLINLSGGGSQMQIFYNLPAGASIEYQNFSGSNGSGTNTSNTIDYTNGTSQVQLFTGLGSGISSEYENFTGANGTGTLTSTVYNMAVGNDGTQTISNSTLNILTNSTVTINGSSNTINAGGSDTVYVASTGNTTTITGNGTMVVDSGTNNTTTDNGANGNMVLTNNNDNAVSNGSGTNISLIGNSDTGTLAGANDTASIQGTNDTITATGTGAGFDLRGSSNTGNLNGSNETAYANGTNDTFNATSATIIVSSSLQGTTTVNGNGNTINVGASDTIHVGATGGSGNFTTITGNGTTVVDYGMNNTTVDNGANGNMVIANNNDNAVSNNSGNNITLLCTSDIATLAGANDTASIQGTSDTITATGTSAAFDLRGNSDTGNLNGSNEIAYVNGANETVNSTGSGNTVAIAGGLTVTINGSNLNIDAAAGDTITLNGTAGTNHISGSGAYTLIVNGVNKGNGNNYGTYGFAGNASVVAAALDPNSNAIVQNDLADGNLTGAAAAQDSLQQLQDVISTGSTASVLEGAKWNSNVITWSAEGNLAAYQGDVQAAFNTWGASTGLTFEEVSNPSQADINLEFSALNTPTSGIAGYTNYTASNGQMSNATVQIEDPNQDALVGGTTYSGTSATLQQTLEHEIGHALGFADNNNPNSIMDYYLGSKNQTLSSNDIAAAQSLYGVPTSATTEASYLQLIQAMASFGTDTGTVASPTNIIEPYILTGTIMTNPMQPQH